MLGCLLLLLGAPAEPVERIDCYLAGLAPQHVLAPWRQRCVERTGTDPQRYLWLNDDWRAEPWAGVAVRRQAGEGWRLTADWLRAGFVRFLVNASVDRYGSPNGSVALQLRPEVAGAEYQHLTSGFVAGGRGLDEDDGSWQEVLVPLRFWTNLQAGQEVRGLSIQCIERPILAYGLAELGFVRYAEPPPSAADRGSRETREPQVTWPTVAELPAALRADQRPPTVVNRQFVDSTGRRVFVLNPYCREDHRLDLLGTTEAGRGPVPGLNLYAPQHAWIYEQLPDQAALLRLGFNSYSVTMPGQPFWDAVGYRGRDRGEDAGLLAATARRVGLPFFVDTVAWPWTLGAPGNEPGKSSLPASALTTGRHHWTWYRPDGTGRETWLRLWRVYAERYRAANVPVLMYELLNEPAYRGVSADHRAGFAAWLAQRYGTVATLNQTWGSQYPDLATAAAVQDEARDAFAGRQLDYDEYLAGLFEELIRAGVDEVQHALPTALVGVQPMGGYALLPREAIWKHHLVAHETVVLTPTGGGRWTTGRGAARPAAQPWEQPISSSPLEPDLLRVLAGPKMIFDNETYLTGSTAAAVCERLWLQVFAGLDGLTVFSWSKRGWAWWQGQAAVLTEADKYPYSELNPYARPTSALRGIHDFAAQVQPLADRLLPKPWGPTPRLGLLYSWAQARRQSWDAGLQDRSAPYHQALTYGHWNFALAPSDRPLDGFDVLLSPGLRHLEPARREHLRARVAAGATLLLAIEPADRDLYDRPLPGDDLAGATFGAAEPAAGRALATSPALPLAGLLRPLQPSAGSQVVLADDQGRPLVTRRALGRGQVYAIGADLAGYRLERLLRAVLTHAAGGALPATWQTVELRDAAGATLPNILVSRRARPQREALLLLNRDDYSKEAVLRLPDRPATWLVQSLLPAGGVQPLGAGYRLALPPRQTVVLELRAP
ncbi:MAG: beta-galactosidase [Fimbriimonadaceae bacterium]|nr:beta-galactosidase [Fimbriimonadaceae bacterium]